MGSRSITTHWKHMGYGKGLGRSRISQGEGGFTLVELLLALFLFALIAAVIFAAFAAVASGVEKGRQHIELYHVGRVALLRMAQTLRNAQQYARAFITTLALPM